MIERCIVVKLRCCIMRMLYDDDAYDDDVLHWWYYMMLFIIDELRSYKRGCWCCIVVSSTYAF